MKERLTNNLGLKLLSLCLAFFVWLVVVNISNPSITGSKVVTVEVLNEDILTKAGLTYSITEKNSVTVRYQVRTLDEYKIKSSDFRVYIDLNDLYKATGAVPIRIEVLNNKELVESVEAKPDILHVTTERLQKKRFDLRVVPVGTLEDGYALGTTTLSKDYVYVSGPELTIGSISSVGIEVDVENAVSDISGTAEPKFYDGNGNQLSLGEKVTIDTKSVDYQTQILKVKNLALDFEMEGTVADGYRYTGVECDVQNVPVIGLKSALASVNTITIPREVLNVQGAISDKVVKIDITPYLPAGTTIVGDNSVITVTMNVEKLVTKTLSISLKELPKSGGRETYLYVTDKDAVEVVVEGLKDDLDGLKPEELYAYLDVEGAEPGVQGGKLTFTPDDSFRIISYESFTVEITDQDVTTVAETSQEESSTQESSTED